MGPRAPRSVPIPDALALSLLTPGTPHARVLSSMARRDIECGLAEGLLPNSDGLVEFAGICMEVVKAAARGSGVSCEEFVSAINVASVQVSPVGSARPAAELHIRSPSGRTFGEAFGPPNVPGPSDPRHPGERSGDSSLGSSPTPRGEGDSVERSSSRRCNRRELPEGGMGPWQDVVLGAWFAAIKSFRGGS